MSLLSSDIVRLGGVDLELPSSHSHGSLVSLARWAFSAVKRSVSCIFRAGQG